MSTIALGELFANRVPGLDPLSFPDETFELWSIPAFDTGKPDITRGDQIGSSKKCLEPGDVLLSRIVPHIRRAWVVEERSAHRQIGSGEWIVFRSPLFAPEYLRHYLVSDEFHARFMGTVAGVGGSLLRARPDEVRKFPIVLPPLDEQRRIAAILDQADALRRKRREALGMYSHLQQSIFEDAFGWRAARGAGWPEVSFSELCHRVTVGIVVKPAAYYKPNGVPAIRGTNITAGGLDMNDVVYVSDSDNNSVLSKTRVWESDLVIVRSGRPGLAAVVPASLSGCNSIDVIVATPDLSVARSDFLRDYLNSAPVRRSTILESRGQIQQHFNVGSLSKSKLSLPPLDKQEAYAKDLQAIHELADRTGKSLTQLDTLIASLQNRAFRGEL